VWIVKGLELPAISRFASVGRRQKIIQGGNNGKKDPKLAKNTEK